MRKILLTLAVMAAAVGSSQPTIAQSVSAQQERTQITFSPQAPQMQGEVVKFTSKNGYLTVPLLRFFPRSKMPKLILLRQSKKPSAVAQDNGSHTPEVGSSERKAILNTYRAKWKQQGGGEITDVVFRVNFLSVDKGWAWLEVDPQSSDASQHYESEQGLLRRKGGKWEVLERAAGTDRNYFKKLKAKYPSVPMDIFPPQ